MLTAILLPSVAAVLVVYAVLRILQWRKLPPGPIGLPILGSFGLKQPLMQLDVFAAEMHRKYGDITSIRVGSRLTVLLHTYDAVREAFIDKGEVFSGRPTDVESDNDVLTKGIVWSEGELWRRLRRFTVSSLRDFGMGKLSIEGKIRHEVDELCDELEGRIGESFDPYPLLSNAVANITCNIVFGNRFEYSDDRFKQLIRVLNDLLSNSPFMNIVYFFPWLKYILYRKWITDEKKKLEEIYNFIRELMNEHKKSRKAGAPPRDFLDAIMDESSGSALNSAVYAEHTIPIISQLFIAGTDTTATTLQWIIWFLLKYPDVQERLYDHIVEAVGPEGHLLYEERSKVPYLEAFILEVQRLANVAPMSLPHATTTEVQLRGYTIPARCTVHASLMDLHTDPYYWKHPNKFNPDRFIMENGQVNYRHPSFMPFSTGKRICLGESLAKSELFNFTAGLVQRFRLANPIGVDKPPEGFQYGLTTHPVAYNIRLLSRQ